MEKEKRTPETHELRDRPVPPVKGAVTDWSDAVLRPDEEMKAHMPDQYDAVRYEMWQYPF